MIPKAGRCRFLANAYESRGCRAAAAPSGPKPIPKRGTDSDASTSASDNSNTLRTCSSTALRSSFERFSSVITPSTPTAPTKQTRIVLTQRGTRAARTTLRTVLLVIVEAKLPETPSLFFADGHLCCRRHRAAPGGRTRAPDSGLAGHHCGAEDIKCKRRR